MDEARGRAEWRRTALLAASIARMAGVKDVSTADFDPYESADEARAQAKKLKALHGRLRARRRGQKEVTE